MSDIGPCRLTVGDLDRLLTLVGAAGYRLLGPVRRDGAIIYDDIASTADLPRGWTDVQSPGSYRLERRDDDALFGYNVGPQAWKKFLFPATERLWQIDRNANLIAPATAPHQPLALLGVRGCELAGIARQDRVFGGGRYTDPGYQSRREDAFIVAVECTAAGGTCFCTSMATGPAAGPGHDIALIEFVGEAHYFVARAGSSRGERMLAELKAPAATIAEVDTAAERVAAAANQMGRTLDTENLPAILLRQLDSPHWDDVANRCLACANCTLACPTCFCSSIEDTTSIDGDRMERSRHWDSCFSAGFSYLHGGEVRAGGSARYRQWLTHKLATWHDQFGTSGCVGCGRCMTWCPVGIDLTVEAARLRELDDANENA